MGALHITLGHNFELMVDLIKDFLLTWFQHIRYLLDIFLPLFDQEFHLISYLYQLSLVLANLFQQVISFLLQFRKSSVQFLWE